MIIHFTNELDKLISILSSKSFLLRYCGEYFGNKDGQVISQAAHPMVSFSEYTHNELINKVITYGGYGIAISKVWAKENGLTPVNYVEKNSPVALGLIALLRARQNRNGALPKYLRLPVIQLKCFTKHVDGYNSYLNEDNFCFKNENEWRFVPTKKQIKGNLISVNLSAYNKNKNKYNDQIKPYSLKFLDENIEYIYVQTDSEREQVISKFGFSEEKVCLSNWKLSNP